MDDVHLFFLKFLIRHTQFEIIAKIEMAPVAVFELSQLGDERLQSGFTLIVNVNIQVTFLI